MSTLSLDEITALLKSKEASSDGVIAGKRYPSPIQVGPLRYGYEEALRCVSKGCSAPSGIKINSVPYCSVHAIYELNRIWLIENDLEWVVNECTCNAGKYSFQCCHTDDCAVYERLKEQRDKSSQ